MVLFMFQRKNIIISIVFGVSVLNLMYLLTINKWAKHCVPHSDLLNLYGLPNPCDNSHFIQDCVDPYQSYLTDPHVLSSCGLMADTSSAELFGKLRDQIKQAPNQCRKRKEILLSFKSERPKFEFGPPQPEGQLVPNVVHYISLRCERLFKFHYYLSVLSVHRFIKPEKIFFHGDCTPKGKWWNRVLEEIPNIYFRNRTRVKTIQGHAPLWMAHEYDVLRLQVLMGKIPYLFPSSSCCE